MQRKICGPIDPPYGPFRYFMVLSTKWFHIYLLSTRKQARFLVYLIKKIHLNNASEFTSQTYNNYCMSIGINVGHPVTQTCNGLA